MRISRRHFAKGATIGAMSLGLPSRLALGQNATPHYFLYIWYGPGADASYLFDARPLEMTAKGKIQNYLWEEPTVHTGTNGNKALITSLAAPLVPYLDRFSILNGVQMATGDDGHSQNISYLLTGNPLLSGPSLLAELRKPDASLDFFQLGTQSDIDKVSFTNAPAGLAIDLGSAISLSATFSMQGSGNTDPVVAARRKALDGFIAGQAAKRSGGNGLFSRGARDLLNGFNGSEAMANKLGQVSIDTSAAEALQSIGLIHQYFALNITQSAMMIFNNEDFDSHSEGQAKSQPENFGALVDFLVTIFKYLKETPFDAAAGLSLLDVTTVLCGSEFSRTMRQEGKVIDATGTDHNSLTNSLLIGGKGIKGGLVLGQSDLDQLGTDGEFMNVSGAHKLLDPKMIKSMGKPFDPQTMAVVDALPQTFDKHAYLSSNMVVNTIHEIFGTKDALRRKFLQSEPSVPFIKGLLV